MDAALDPVANSRIQVSRQDWRKVAESLEVPFVEIEVICSDSREHRYRIETREADIPGFVLPTLGEGQKPTV